MIPSRLSAFFALVQALHGDGLLLAYHDISDGGIFVTLAEMAFASRCGLDIVLPADGADALASLFAEELGAVVQVAAGDAAAVLARAHGAGIAAQVVGTPVGGDRITVRHGTATVLDEARVDLHRAWSSTTHAMQRLRDNPQAADQEYARIADADDPGLAPRVGFAIDEDPATPFIGVGARPRVAILREQGVNGQVEMAAAFTRAGFDALDVHMSDLAEGRRSLAAFRGVVAGGGFSYGDVLGAGEGWAKSILFNARLRDAFAAFFARGDTFALGVCNGCQMMSNLHEIVPGSGALAAFRPQRVGAVRGAPGPARGARHAFAVLPRNGGQPAAGGTGARRGLRGIPRRSPARGSTTVCRAALRRPPGPRDRGVSVQSQRLAGGHHGTHDSGRTLHGPDAASGARLPQRADVVAPSRLGRALAVVPDVRQREALGGLTRGHRGRVRVPVARSRACDMEIRWNRMSIRSMA